MASWAMTIRCHASLLTGDLHEAVRFGERGAAAAAASSSPLSGIARVQLAEALLEVGEPARCRAELTSADGHPDLPPFPLYEARCFELLARAAIALVRRRRRGLVRQARREHREPRLAEAPARAREPGARGAAAASRRVRGGGPRGAGLRRGGDRGQRADRRRPRPHPRRQGAGRGGQEGPRRSRSSRPPASSSSPATPSATATRPGASCAGSAARSRGAATTPASTRSA